MGHPQLFQSPGRTGSAVTVKPDNTVQIRVFLNIGGNDGFCPVTPGIQVINRADYIDMGVARNLLLKAPETCLHIIKIDHPQH